MATIGAAVLGGVASAVVGSILAPRPHQQQQAVIPPVEAPDVPDPVVMPDSDSQAVEAAKKRSLIDQLSRRGRQSTILSGTTNDDALGGV